MLRNPYTPYANAWEALNCKERSRRRGRIPAWANPYTMPSVPNYCCPQHVQVPEHLMAALPGVQPGHAALFKF